MKGYVDMPNMKELYEKVAADSALQEKFKEIMGSAEKDGKEATEAKLTAFAKEAGYAVTTAEMTEFFKQMSDEQIGELSDSDMDMVAGGKNKAGLAISIFGLGVSCGVVSFSLEVTEGLCAEFMRQ